MTLELKAMCATLGGCPAGPLYRWEIGGSAKNIPRRAVVLNLMVVRGCKVVSDDIIGGLSNIPGCQYFYPCFCPVCQY